MCGFFFDPPNLKTEVTAMDRMAIMASTTMRKTATAALAACFVLPGTASATNVLFGFVGTATYVTDGQQLAGMIAALPGFNVTQRTLNTAVYNDYGSFDQVWVYDLVTGSDNNAFQTANYQNIAAWYNSLSNKNLIVDGRIISSAPSWTNAGGFPAEDAWIQSYATALDGAGGGLLLGTDHNEYHGRHQSDQRRDWHQQFQRLFRHLSDQSSCGRYAVAAVRTDRPLHHKPIAAVHQRQFNDGFRADRTAAERAVPDTGGLSRDKLHRFRQCCRSRHLRQRHFPTPEPASPALVLGTLCLLGLFAGRSKS
jgi:hypothetical protein